MASILSTPLDDQKEGVALMEGKFKGRFLLADDMGLGKSASILYWHARNRMPTTQWPKVIVCPANVKGRMGWEHEAKAHIGVRATVLEGQTPRTIPQGHHSSLIVLNYDILPYWLEELKKIRPQSVVGDECQNLTNRDANRTQAFVELCRGVPYIGATSGSPFMNGPYELFPMLNILRPDVFTSPWTFGWRFCKARYVRGEWQFPGAQNKDELRQLLLDTVMIRRTRVSRVKTRIIPVDIEDRGQYQFASNDFMGWLRTKSSRRARRAVRAEAYVKVNYLRQLAAKLKLRAVVGQINSFLEKNEDKKLLVFAVHRKMIEALRRRINYDTTSIIGGMGKEAREEAMYGFQRRPQVRAMVNNLMAGGVGLNGLQTVTNYVAHTELAWRPKDHEQGDCRLDRLGQTKPVVHSIWLVANGTIEERMCEILQDKSGTFAHIMDGIDTEEEGGVLNIFDMLLESLAEDARNGKK